MKLAFSTIGCPEWSWEDIVSAAADLGYDGVEVRGVKNELSAPRIPQFSAEKLPGTRAQLQRLNLAIPCLTSGCVLGDAAGHEAALAEARAYIDCASALGAQFIRVMAESTAQPSATVDEALVADALSSLAPYAAAKSVQVLLETNGIYADSARLAALMHRVDAPGLGVLWDIHHPFRFFGEAPALTVERLGRWIRYVHVKDSLLEDGKLRYRMLGQGDLPVRACAAALRDIGYDGWYTLEWVRRWDMTLEEPGIAFAHFVGTMKGIY